MESATNPSVPTSTGISIHLHLFNLHILLRSSYDFVLMCAPCTPLSEGTVSSIKISRMVESDGRNAMPRLTRPFIKCILV